MRQKLAVVFLLFSNIINAQLVQTNGPYSGTVKCITGNGSSIFVGTEWGGVYSSSNGGSIWTPVNSGLPERIWPTALVSNGSNVFIGTHAGVYLTINNGISWTQVNNGLTTTTILSLAISGSDIFAGTNDGVFLSTNNGNSWTQMNNGIQPTSIIVSGTNIFAGTYNGVYLSTNNGSVWSQVNNGLTSLGISSFIVDGANIFTGTGDGVFLSTDTGSNWTQLNSGLTNTNIRSLAISGSSIFAGTDGDGIFLSTNSGSNWTQVNNGLTNWTVYSLFTIGSNIYAGTKDGVFLSNNNGSSWIQNNYGILASQVNSLTVSGSNIFAGVQGGAYLSTNDGSSWIPINNGLPYTVRCMAVKDSSIFAGTDSGVFKSTNNGNNWTQVNNGLTNISVYELAISGNNIFAGTDGGGVFLSSDTGSNWTQLNSGPNNTNIRSLAISGSSIFSGTDYGGGGLFVSNNNGNSWNQVINNQNCSFTSIAISDSNIFLGTLNCGVNLSNDNGNSWTSINNGLTTSYIMSMTSSGSFIFAGSDGDGLFLSNNNGSSWTQINNGSTEIYFPSLAVRGSTILAGGISSGVWRYHIPSSIIKGRVFNDNNSNCIYDSSDQGVSVHGHLPWIVQATKSGEEYLVIPDSIGYYSLNVDTGTYILSLLNPTPLYSIACPPAGTYQVSVVSDTDTINNIDFAVQSQISCSSMRTSVSSSFFRPCMSTTIAVDYCNEGTVPETNAVVKLILPTELTMTSSSIPWTSVTGNTYTYNIGIVQAGSCGSFTVSAALLCDPAALLNATLCVTSEILPAEFCLPTDTAWDKSSIHVTGDCVGDTLVCFTLTNDGSSVNGNMQGPSQWRLYSDNILVQQGTFQLQGGNDTILCFSTNGQTLRLNADQRPHHPGHSHPNANVERCGILTGGQTYSLGQILQTPLNNGLPFFSEYCAVVRTSYDPNDKQVRPEGMTGNHFIRNEDRLEYKINFQNTGNDTAFTVVIRDTLDLLSLDMNTFVLGAASHQYDFSIEGQGVLVWRFENILLPDSNVDEPLSHGYVSFSIDQLPGLAMGTQLMNHADIYFDFNLPVMTNTVINTVCVTTQPIISFNGNQLEATLGSSYQWFLDGEAITGAFDQTYTPLSLGNYTVEVLDINGCSSLSDPFNLLTLSTPSVIKSSIIATLFPNPTSQKSTLSIIPSAIGNMQISLIGIAGQNHKILYDKRVEQNQTLHLPIDTDVLESGVYIIQIKMGYNVRYLRLIVVK